LDLLLQLVQFVLHLDTHLADLVVHYGALIYAILFVIVFCETGLVVTPFLPGDSLLFAAGALAAVGSMDPWILAAVLIVAAILGNTSNYWIGRYIGPRVFHWEGSRWFNRGALDQAHAFYERYGGVTVIAARFMPFLRTFAPFVAGVAQMTRSRFTLFDVTGGALWIGSVTLAGYMFGNIPWVKDNLDKIIWAAIFIPGLLVLIGAWRARKKPSRTAA
jgi:membrane-associated protein